MEGEKGKGIHENLFLCGDKYILNCREELLNKRGGNTKNVGKI